MDLVIFMVLSFFTFIWHIFNALLLMCCSQKIFSTDPSHLGKKLLYYLFEGDLNFNFMSNCGKKKIYLNEGFLSINE